MKKIKYILVMLAALLLCGNVASAATLTDSFVTDDNNYREVEYIKNAPIIVKTTDNGKTYLYCMNMSNPLGTGGGATADANTYKANMTYKRAGKAQDGYLYILKNKPSTGDKDKDFYIAQMAVWYYGDILNGDKLNTGIKHTSDNLPAVYKAYIDKHASTEEVSKYVYDLVKGAINYSAPTQKLNITTKSNEVTFKVVNNYYVSSEIIIDKQNIGNLKSELANAPDESVVEETTNGVIVKVPVANVKDSISFTLNVSATNEKESAIYYEAGEGYQNLLYSVIETEEIKDSIEIKENIYDVKISKTDITGSNEVEGATLVVKDNDGSVIETWVSTKETHNIKLVPGKYTLTETIAPKGYKLSSTTITFLVSEDGTIYVKSNGVYETVDKVVMINELIDVVTINKIDADTKEIVSGAKLVIKDENGNVVKEFTTSNESSKIELNSGYYTLSEIEAPNGYVLSNEVIYFYLGEDGTLKIKNESGEYVESASVTFENTKKVSKDVIVPATGLNSYTLLIGAALLVVGIICVKKYSKEC